MRPQGCQETGFCSHPLKGLPQLADFKPVCPLIVLTLSKTGAYTHQMPTRIALAALGVVAASILCPVAPFAQAIQKVMYVSVVDAAGAPVADLKPSDFLVREDNAPREVLSVAPADDPMQLAVLADNTQAARNFIRDIRVGLEGFVTDMLNGTKNEISIIGLAERPTILANVSSDRAAVLKGVYRIFEMPLSGSYLLDALIDVGKGFSKREAKRPVVVVLTTEGPEFSSRRYEDVLKPLDDLGAALHVVVLGPPSNDISEDSRNRSAVLDEGPRKSGGARESLLAGSALPGSLKRLAADLKHQYRVTYARPQSLIPPERATVSATRPGLTARGTLIKDRPQARP